MSDSSELKKFQRQRGHFQKIANDSAQRIRELAVTMREARAQVKVFDAEIERIKAEPVVSEHAILRFIERVLGMDTKVFTDAILGGKAREHIAKFGSGKFPVKAPADAPVSEFRIVVKDGVVVTVE